MLFADLLSILRLSELQSNAQSRNGGVTGMAGVTGMVEIAGMAGHTTQARIQPQLIGCALTQEPGCP